MHTFAPYAYSLTEAESTHSLRITLAEALMIARDIGEASGRDNGTTWWNMTVSEESGRTHACKLVIDRWGTCTIATRVGGVHALCYALGELIRSVEIIVEPMPRAA